MSSKAAGILAKAQADRVRGDYERALKRLAEAIALEPGDLTLHKEAIDIAVEAGESMRAVQYFKTAHQKLPNEFQELWQFGREKIEAFNDPVLCKYLLDIAVRKRDLDAAEDVLEALKDHTASDLLARTRNKRQSLDAASQTFKTEMTTNMMAEAMLCIRSKQFDDGAKTFVQILDDKPAEHQALTPYLAGLQKKHPKRGVIAHALGCSCLMSGDQVRAIAMLVRAAFLSPATANDAVKRIEKLVGAPDAPQDDVEFALAQLLILKGDVHIASTRLSKLLEKNHRRAPAILELLEPHVDTIGDNLVLSYLYIEAALVSGGQTRAIHLIKKIYGDERHRRDLLAWLELKSHERFMTVEVLCRYGEMALGSQMYEKAIEVFRRVLSQAPNEVHLIKETLAGHVKDDAGIKAFHGEIAEADGENPQGADGFAIEHYGESGFRLDLNARQGAPTAPKARPTTPPLNEPEPSFDDAPVAPSHHATEEPAAPVAPAVPSRRATDPPPAPVPPAAPSRRATDVPPAPVAPAAPSRRATDVPPAPVPPAAPSRRATDAPPAPVPPAAPSRRATDPPSAPVPPTPVASAAPSRRATNEPPAPEPATASRPPIDAPETPAETPPPAPFALPAPEDSSNGGTSQVILLGVSDVVEDAATTEEMDAGGNGAPTGDFDPRYRAFENGDLNNDEILDLADVAVRLGRTEQLKALLTFTPTTAAQDIKRKYFLAEYYLEEDDPLSALVVLKSVDLGALAREERKKFMLKHAYCYQQLGQFDAAHGVYLKILSENPSFTEAEHMARVAYERHVASSASDPVLQKVTRLRSEREEEEL